ncbi:hypothetical protein HYQ46_001958 [Verticillium longisporum]|nr:hypothetical protein HYQ46_001958 [Verticillium longisporum]
MSPILIIGATRGLGAALIKRYAEQPGYTVYGTTRSSQAPAHFPPQIKWLPDIDLTEQSVGSKLVSLLGGAQPLSAVFVTAGYFTTEDLSADKGPNWAEEQRMYTTSAIAPVFLVHAADPLD